MLFVVMNYARYVLFHPDWPFDRHATAFRRSANNPTIMSISTLPLSYCTNVHPGRSLAEVEQGLDDYTVQVRERFSDPLAAGLWLASPVVTELLASPSVVPRLAEGLQRRGLTCHTLNAFPYGDFHSERVKENVYIPDWSQPERLGYTFDCANVLAALLPEGVEGSISTVPLGFKEFEREQGFLDAALAQLIELAGRLEELHNRTGKLIRLAIEPEPFCLIETTDEALRFFEQLWERAADENLLPVAQQHLGLCYDVCHQSVEFEDVTRSIESLDRAEIRINKLHITCAIEIENPSENRDGREALARYAEPRYLHQTMARTRDGEVLRAVDLSQQLALNPDADFLEAQTWRIHFHVPVDCEALGPLGTTREDLKRALSAVAHLSYAPHLEVETYTWEVLPGGGPSTSLVEGLTSELQATQTLLGELR
jgi:sugar phosphate isomerase/epimerase